MAATSCGLYNVNRIWSSPPGSWVATEIWSGRATATRTMTKIEAKRSAECIGLLGCIRFLRGTAPFIGHRPSRFLNNDEIVGVGITPMDLNGIIQRSRGIPLKHPWDVRIDLKGLYVWVEQGQPVWPEHRFTLEGGNTLPNRFDIICSIYCNMSVTQ